MSVELDLFSAPPEPAGTSSFPTTNEEPAEFRAEIETAETTLEEQAALFEIDHFEVAPPDADIQEAREATGRTINAFKRMYDETTIRQIVSYFHKDDYTRVLGWMDRVMNHYKLKNHTEVLDRLLTDWINGHS